jgi:CubicO group peptidase (beta-lactamase class C family)
MLRGRIRTAVLLAVAVPLVLVAHQPASTPFDGLDRLVADVMREWRVPGLAVAAIKDGTVVLSKGFGYRDVEKQLPVTPQTLMAIGSNSKSFTVTLMGMLSDEGQLDWDKPVRTYLPDFELHDDVSERLMTPTDLVTHRSGLPRHDGMWFGRAFSRKDLYHRL